VICSRMIKEVPWRGLESFELEPIQAHMTYKPLMWVEVGVHVRCATDQSAVGWVGSFYL
jgi:hypothetical protein